MKTTNVKVFSAFLLAILFLGFFPITALAAPLNGLVIGNSYTLEGGETLNDDLVVIGGTVNLMEGSTVNGTVVLLGGILDAAGTVTEDMIILGGAVNMTETFILKGNLFTAGASMNRDPAAQIYGEINTGENIPMLVLPGGFRFSNPLANFNPILKIGGFFLKIFLWALVAMVIAMFIPQNLERTSKSALSQPLISGGLGLLTAVIAPIVLIFLAITICLLPIALIGLFLLVIAWAYGIISFGLEVGKRIAVMAKQDWHPAISAGLGTLLLMAILSGLESFLPCIGWIPQALVGFVGLGAVLLTQFGRVSYNNQPTLPEKNTGDVLPAQD